MKKTNPRKKKKEKKLRLQSRQWVKLSERKDGTEGDTHTPNEHESQSKRKKIRTESDKWRTLKQISWVECVCVGWSLCSSEEIHQDRPCIHSHTLSLSPSHKRTHTDHKASLYFSGKSHDFKFRPFLWQRNQPSTNHSCSGRSLKLLFSY